MWPCFNVAATADPEEIRYRPVRECKKCVHKTPIKFMFHCQNLTIVYDIWFSLRQMFRPKSNIYHEPETGDGLSDRLTSSAFDLSKPSGKRKLEKPRTRNDPVRGQPRVRELGNHKAGDFSYRKL